MPAAGFKELVLTTFPVSSARRKFKTSGTTREARGVHFFDTLALYDAALWPLFEEYLLDDNVRPVCFFLMPPPAEAPESSLSYMMGEIRRRVGGKGKFYVRKGELRHEKLLSDLRTQKNKKVMLLATAFALKSFLDFLKNRKERLRLPRGSRLMETGGFKGRVKEISKMRLYAECAEWLGIGRSFCVSEYGMTELSSQFYMKRNSYFRGPSWTRTIVVDPRTGLEAKKGSEGILRHWDLANRGSVLAVETEDWGRTKGKGFELLGRAPGAQLRGCSLRYEKFLRSSK